MSGFRVRFRVSVCWGIAALAAVPLLLAQDEPKNASNPAPVPFYRKYLVAGNPLDEQILVLEQKVDANPDDASLHNDFGNLLALRRFPEQAAEQYELAAGLDKTNFIAYYNLGILRETEGKTGDAIAAYKKSIARKPGFPQSRFRLGRLYEREGHLDAAVAQYAKALRIDPSMRNPHRNPLVIDSAVMYRASLDNYERDVARVTLDRDVSFVEEPAFRRVAVDRALASAEVEADEPETPPREVGPASPAGSSPAASTPKHPVRSAGATAGEPPMRPRSGSRPGPRTTRPGPGTPGGTGTHPPEPPAETPETATPETMAPETAPPPEEAPAEVAPAPEASQAPPGPEPTPEPAPEPPPEDLEPS